MLSALKEKAQIQLQYRQRYLIDYFKTHNCKDEWLKIYSSFIKELDNLKYEGYIKNLLRDKKFLLSHKSKDIVKARESVNINYNYLVDLIVKKIWIDGKITFSRF